MHSYKRQVGVCNEEVKKAKDDHISVERELHETLSKVKIIEAHIGTLARLVDCHRDTSHLPAEEILINIISKMNK